MNSTHTIRRDFLKKLAAASAAAWSTGEPQAVWANASKVTHPPAKADACILLWMGGGMAAPDTFDPKRYLPFEKGLEVAKMLSTFPAIDTAVDGLKICQGLENIAQYVPFLHWDTHKDGHQTVAKLHQEIDLPIATLIRDLEERGLLERTLVIIASEFSRDAMIEGKPGSNANDQATFKVDTLGEMAHYGLHRHFTGGTSVVLFGGGMKKGHIHGQTADERPLIAIKDPVTVMDLHATIMTAMGISPKTEFTIEGRPFYVTEDGKGQPVMDLFA